MASPGRRSDAAEQAAKVELRRVWEDDPQRICYSKQLEVFYENTWFHWITNRAIRSLIAEGFLIPSPQTLPSGRQLQLLRHRSNRYPRRAEARVGALVDEYSTQEVGEALGDRGEHLVLEGLAKRQFVVYGRHTRSFQGKTWMDTAHNLDFILGRDGEVYGLEVKNALSYMDRLELDTKLDMCDYLGVRPFFAVRAMPRTWVLEVERQGGFTLIMRYQLYPLLLKDLVARIKDELGLPVDCPRALYDGTVDRFVGWHERQFV